MDLAIGTIIHGFRVERIRTIDELGATCCELKHEKTGAELVWMDNGEENKLFSIAFKTLPEDSTGVFHILEHSVLCGSEEYPVKEPFVELIKGSLNTFLNAMTFPDKTMYPVSSRNKTDFINLSRVYLDAVFKPAILSNPNIFYQEGWHYELENAEAEPSYNGVVFNEMKGAYSSVDRVADMNMSALLFPDNCYGKSSGGDPVHIPELTYEQFIETYKRCYHPSNSRIYLDGSVPFDEILEIIDTEYLSGFERGSAMELELQQPVETVESVCSYEIGAQEDPAGKTIMMMGKVVCDWSDREKQLAVHVLGNYLTGSNESPLKKAILEAGLAQDVTMSISDGIAQPHMYLTVRNTDYDKRDELFRVIRETAENLLQSGLDRQSIEASINRLEFKLRESEEPMGLERAIYALSSWLYGGDPMLYLTQDEVFESLRAHLDGDYFAQLLNECLVDDAHRATVFCTPSQTLGEEKRADESRRIADAKSKWSEQDVESILALNAALNEWQQTPDSAEKLATLPQLSLSEVNPEPSERVTTTELYEDVTVIRHPSTAKGIVYLNFYFNIADLSQEQIPAAALMVEMLGKLPTRKHSVAELDREIKTHIGDLSFAVEQYGVAGQTDRCRVFAVAKCSVLESELDNAMPLITEVLTETRFDRYDDIKTLIAQFFDRKRRMVIAGGHAFGLVRATAPYSAEATVREAVDGYTGFDYLRTLSTADNDGISEFAGFAAGLAYNTFTSARLTLSVTSDNSELSVAGIIDALPQSDSIDLDFMRPVLAPQRRECLSIPAPVSYAEMGINVYSIGAEYSAELQLLAHIISYNYLWNEIRVQGGAYGAGLMANNTGAVCFYTYRDPNSARSLGVYRKASEFLRGFCAEDGSLDKSIIGCISNMDPLSSAKDTGAAADADYFRGNTHEKRCKVWNDLLHTDRQKLLKLCDLLDELTQKGSICVVGGADIVAACADENLSELTF